MGSSGTYVFRGYVQHTTRARHAVAVKRIQRPPGEEGRELLKLVEREVELLTALNQSPKVPFFHCWGITSLHVFIALELCTEACEGYREALGSGARPTLGAVFELGLTRLRCDDYEAAEQLLQEAVDGHKLVAGPHSVATVRWVRGHARGVGPVDRRPSTVDR